MFCLKPIRLIFLSLFILISGLGCDSDSSNDQVQVFSFDNTEYAVLMDDLLVLQQAIGLKQVLKAAPERTLGMINAAIFQARSGLLLLAKTGERTLEEKQKVYTAFGNAIRQYEAFRVLEIEQERFDRVFNQVRYLKSELSQELGIDEAKASWTIFNHNFSTSGLEPTFTTMGFSKTGRPNDEARWFTNFQTDLPKARAQGRDGSYGWMISRPFDLSQVENPSFRYFGSYLVVAPNNVLPLSQVIREVFKTYILLDYQPGDNPETYPADRKILVTYNLDDLPLGRDFDDAWTPYVSLSPYRDRTLAVGFLFDTRGINFTQYYSWTIFDFEINGSGKIKEDPVKYKEEFQGSNLGLYKSYSLEFPGENWKALDHKATINVKADDTNTKDFVDSFLLSPKLDVPKDLVNPELKIEESFLKQNYNPDNLKNFEIMISKNFLGGTSPVNAEWQLLKRSDLNLTESASSFNLTHVFDLSEYQGQEIVVAFRFNSKDRKAEAHTIDWSIESVQILGQQATVTVIDYILPEVTDYRLAFFDFLKASVKDFKIEMGDNAPAWNKKAGGFVISGFNGVGSPSSLGPTRLVFPTLDLTGKSDVRLRLNQKVFFFRNNTQSSEVIKIQIRKIGDVDWTTLEVPAGTFRDEMPRETELSSWIKIPDLFLGTEVELSLFYQARSGNGGTVEWTFGSLEVGSK